MSFGVDRRAGLAVGDRLHSVRIIVESSIGLRCLCRFSPCRNGAGAPSAWILALSRAQAVSWPMLGASVAPLAGCRLRIRSAGQPPWPDQARSAGRTMSAVPELVRGLRGPDGFNCGAKLARQGFRCGIVPVSVIESVQYLDHEGTGLVEHTVNIARWEGIGTHRPPHSDWPSNVFRVGCGRRGRQPELAWTNQSFVQARCPSTQAVWCPLGHRRYVTLRDRQILREHIEHHSVAFELRGHDILGGWHR